MGLIPGRNTGDNGRRRGFWARLRRRIVWTLLGCIAFLLALLLLLRFVNPPVWSWQVHRWINPPEGFSGEFRHQWVDIEEIPVGMQLAVIASEDQRFPLHSGVDTQAIGEAVNEALEGEGLRGASTLTQQTAKNLLLWPGRDWVRKGLELPLAFLLEWIWGKERILEVYLNIAEFGPGVYGVGAASEYWYQRPVQSISDNQAARLAAILPNPWRYSAQPPGPYVQQRARWIERQMRQLGVAWLEPIKD
ncbi:monofunctional biosynthetic peptidoglycan transglycosylase [Marinobacterium mangrovicola]|uniref:Biosynthetic peptidoglycan transglycosylase n=1 Tax=Marinobacterium mangrovicola TaxID=1476959 RepID=A0A4R1GJK0_9GAMM|nr:monofunctional biosynthetic peptidoglycan transglycosylase [Marinobacterium mangrovicola]TCK07360.1 monofunctional biosynthetic peptidoglycan transglycosylase [Marinobacterium mangrovicola]